MPFCDPKKNPAFITPDFSSWQGTRDQDASRLPHIFTTTRHFVRDHTPTGQERFSSPTPDNFDPPAHPRGAAIERAFCDAGAPLSLWLPSPPVWLHQVHGITVADADATPLATLRHTPPHADAIVTRQRGKVLAIQTADCLPVVFFDPNSCTLGAAHAGWRGLAAGVLEATLAAMNVPPDRLCAWIAPAIGKEAFEVGAEVLCAFNAQEDTDAARCFKQKRSNLNEEKWCADLEGLATLKLKRAGVADIAAAGLCTYSDPARFFSYRRSKEDGRMVTFIYFV
ncbi:MAG: peptidoglycan editing factor PgeF [Burkholderiales bacterium]|jgi:YfiH family protein|nr:peptidoglycan editing factor PgeF [Burkholderiales bacterium]